MGRTWVRISICYITGDKTSCAHPTEHEHLNQLPLIYYVKLKRGGIEELEAEEVPFVCTIVRLIQLIKIFYKHLLQIPLSISQSLKK